MLRSVLCGLASQYGWEPHRVPSWKASLDPLGMLSWTIISIGRGLGPHGIAIAIIGDSMLASNFLNSLFGWEPDDLIEGEGDYCDVVDPSSSKVDIVG